MEALTVRRSPKMVTRTVGSTSMRARGADAPFPNAISCSVLGEASPISKLKS
jgi:hypothetical protein